MSGLYLGRSRLQGLFASSQQSVVDRLIHGNHSIPEIAALKALLIERNAVFDKADRQVTWTLQELYRQIVDDLTLADDGCPPGLDSSAKAMDYPLEMWVGGTIFSLANNGFLVQVRDAKSEIHNPAMMCNFGGACRADEPPSETYQREMHEELLGADILHESFVDILRVYPVQVRWGCVLRVVLEMIVPRTPPGLRIGEGVGFTIIDAAKVAAAAGITPLSREDMQLSLAKGNPVLRYTTAIESALEQKWGLGLDGGIFGGESDEPFDQY